MGDDDSTDRELVKVPGNDRIQIALYRGLGNVIVPKKEWVTIEGEKEPTFLKLSFGHNGVAQISRSKMGEYSSNPYARLSLTSHILTVSHANSAIP